MLVHLKIYFMGEIVLGFGNFIVIWSWLYASPEESAEALQFHKQAPSIPWLLTEHELVPKSKLMYMIHILVSPSQGASEGRIQQGIPPPGKARGTLKDSHTGTFFMPSILSQSEIQTDLKF